METSEYSFLPFTAAQAAKKLGNDSDRLVSWFTAAQAAKKMATLREGFQSAFTAAQAAKKHSEWHPRDSK